MKQIKHLTIKSCDKTDFFTLPLTERSRRCQNCENLRETLRTMTMLHRKESQNLSHMLHYKDIALKKRDEMLYEYNQENIELRSRLKALEKQLFLKNSTEKELDDVFEQPRNGQNSPGKMLNNIKLFSHASFSSINQREISPNRSPIRRLSRRVSTFMATPPNPITLFSTESHGVLNILMEEGEDPILNHPKILELEDYFLKGNAGGYLENFSRMNAVSQIELFQTVSVIFTEFKNNISLISKMTKLIRSCQSLSTSLVLDEALVLMVKEICENLKCDRGSIFILDEEKGELWTKAAKGTKTIRVPTNRGVVGYVAMNNASVRIDNAYSDPRFNREIDKKTNYLTKTILCVPIRDNDKLVGVLQAINKHNGVFMPDDEGLLTILANQAGLMLRNSLMYDKLVLNQYKLVKLVNIGMSLFQCISIEMVLLRAEQKLMELANTDKCLIYLVDPETGNLIRYDVASDPHVYEPKIGIVGQCLQTNCQIITPKPNLDPVFNNKVDLDTQLSLVTIPVRSEELEKVLAVIQLVDLHASISKSLGKTSSFETEILNFFIQIFVICVENALKIKGKMREMGEVRKDNEQKKMIHKRMSVQGAPFFKD